MDFASSGIVVDALYSDRRDCWSKFPIVAGAVTRALFTEEEKSVLDLLSAHRKIVNPPVCGDANECDRTSQLS